MTKVADGEAHARAEALGREILQLLQPMVSECVPAGSSDDVFALNKGIAAIGFFLIALDGDLGPAAIEGFGVGIGRYVGQAPDAAVADLIVLLNRGLSRGMAEAAAFMSTAGHG